MEHNSVTATDGAHVSITANLIICRCAREPRKHPVSSHLYISWERRGGSRCDTTLDLGHVNYCVRWEAGGSVAMSQSEPHMTPGVWSSPKRGIIDPQQWSENDCDENSLNLISSPKRNIWVRFSMLMFQFCEIHSRVFTRCNHSHIFAPSTSLRLFEQNINVQNQNSKEERQPFRRHRLYLIWICSLPPT